MCNCLEGELFILSLVIFYRHYPPSEAEDLLFPTPTNQNMNSYLVQFEDQGSINQKLTFHARRNAFTKTISLVKKSMHINRVI